MQKTLMALIFILFGFFHPLEAQTWSVDSMPTNTNYFSVAATTDTKIIMTGDTTVGIYDDLTKTWKTGVLSFGSSGSKAVPIGDKIYFLQGFDRPSNDFSKKMDIYNTTTNTWKRDSMPFAPNGSGLGSVGSKLFVAGGFQYSQTTGQTVVNTIRIYDTLTQRWSYNTTLSVARANPEVIRVKNKLLFIGGYLNNTQDPTYWTYYKNIDIYDETTGQWSVVYMKTGRLFPRLAVSGSKVLIAGGIDKTIYVGASPFGHFTNTCEVYDVDTNTWQNADFPNSRTFGNIGVYSNKAYIICGGVQDFVNTQPPYDKIDIYNFTTNTWTSQPFPYPAHVRSGSTTALKNKIFFIGGQLPNYSLTKRIDIMTLTPTSVLESTILPNELTVSPNPVADVLTVDFDKKDTPQYALKITNVLGQTVYNQTDIQESNTQIDVQSLNTGLYFLTIQTTKGVKTQTFMKQ